MKNRILLYIILNIGSGQAVFAQQDSLPDVSKDTAYVRKPIEQAYTLTGKALSGRAGTYSSKADGSLTANGETFYNNAYTAGCNRFSFNTWLKVTNLKNGQSVLVRINDRVAKKSASLLELSRAAVKALGFLKQGYSKVKIQKISIIDSLSIVSKYKDSAKDHVAHSAVELPAGTPAFRKTGHPVNGIASFYSAGLDGTLTSTGERYRNNKLTAASNFFKLNTWVQVTNLRNHKAVIVRINDRMHPRMKKKGRVVDLSVSAAKQLDFISAGLTRVKVEAIEWTAEDSSNNQQEVTTDSTLAVSDTTGVKEGHSLPEETGTEKLTGTASYLNAGWEGKNTATGEKFTQDSMMAISNRFPLGSWVRVKRLSTGKSVVVRIVDGMSESAQKKGRVLFLSREAARRLGILLAGIVKVQAEKTDPGSLN